MNPLVRLERDGDVAVVVIDNPRGAVLASNTSYLDLDAMAERPTDVDVVLVNGYGFPRWEGGPLFWARERGAAALAADLDELGRVSGPGFVRGRVDVLLNG